MREEFMRKALEEAEKAYKKNEVPIGCVIVKDDVIISKGHNLVETDQSSLRHAEMIALEQATKVLHTWRLYGCSIYVTLEPCLMCTGALLHSRIDTVFYALKDEKRGCCGSLYDLATDRHFNHTMNVVGGLLREESLMLMQDFFRNLRKKDKNN